MTVREFCLCMVASATIGSCMVHAVPKHTLATMHKQNSRTVIE